MSDNKDKSFYIDEIENVDVFKYFRNNGPAGKEFQTDENDMRTHRFISADIVQLGENGKRQLALVLGSGKSSVFAWFAFDDFSCQYKDFNKNEVDMSKDWCKFVCSSVENPKGYAEAYANFMNEKISQLKSEDSENIFQFENDITEMLDFAEGLSSDAEMSE